MGITSVVSKIGNYAKGLSSRKMEVASKALGFATCASVVYDMHVNGKEKAISLDNIETADRYENNYKHFMFMNKPSQTVADLKSWWFDMQNSFSWFHVISRLSGYFYGASQTVLSNLPEIGLSVLALKTKKHPVLGKTAGVLLGVNAVKTLLHDVMGVGSNKS